MSQTGRNRQAEVAKHLLMSQMSPSAMAAMVKLRLTRTDAALVCCCETVLVSVHVPTSRLLLNFVY